MFCVPIDTNNQPWYTEITMIVGAYMLNVYCERDGKGCHSINPLVVIAGNRGTVIHEARLKGWDIHEVDKKAYCPECYRGMKTKINQKGNNEYKFFSRY